MSAVAIGAACLIAALRDDAWWLSRIFASPPFRWIGQRSYGLYLFHFPIFVFLEQFRVPHSPMNFALVTAARVGFTLLVAAFSWSFLERPLMKAQRAHGQQTI
jgi:peptidoglycan/LPS O-acetylase OafA/YrhL